MKKILFLVVICLFLCSCNDKESKEIEPGKINCTEMKEIMKQDSSARLIDVRTSEEYKEEHLDEAINIPVDNIKSIDTISSINLETPIIVYCRSGNRSAQAKEELDKLGYNKVYDLGAMSSCGN